MITHDVHFDPYAAIAEFYDLEHDEFDDDLVFYVNLATMFGGPVLELACGTGRILAPLLDAGLKTTGIDSSAAMLDRARTRLATKRRLAGTTLVQGVMTAADRAPGGPFGVAILGINSLMHAVTSTEQRSVLTSTHSVLRPGGRLLLDLVNPASSAFNAPDLQVLHEGEWKTRAGVRVDKFSSRRLNLVTQEIEVTLWYDLTADAGDLRRIHSGFTQRFVHASELELMLELAGFRDWTLYGGYELEPFSEESDRIVVSAEA